MGAEVDWVGVDRRRTAEGRYIHDGDKKGRMPQLLVKMLNV